MPSPQKIFRSTFAALYYRDYRNFWTGQIVSTIGGMIQVTALSWYVYQISGSPFLLGLMGVFEFGPVLVLTLFAGVIIERVPKKKILFLMEILFMVQSFILAILVWNEVTNYWIFAGLALIAGIAMSVEQPTRQSYFVALVAKKNLHNAISLNSTAFNVARIIGPLIAGIIMEYMGTAQCFLINGISFIPVLYGITRIRVEGKPSNVKKSNIIKEIKDGLLYVVHNEQILPTFLIVLVIGIFAMNYSVILPVLAKDVLLGNERTYSTLMSLFGIGSLCGALFMGGMGKDIRNKYFLVITALSIGALQMITLAFIHSFILIAILLIILGFLSLCFLNRANTRIQMNINETFRGRVMSIYVLVVTGSTPLGNAITGWELNTIGKQYGFFLAGIVTFTAVLLLFIAYKNGLLKARVTADPNHPHYEDLHQHDRKW